MKKAILAVSFGTTHADAESACIRPVEAALAAAFPDWTVFRAWTSRIIARRLKAQGIGIESEDEALARLRNENWDRIAVVSTHIIPGQEYDRLKAAAAPLPVSEPLLSCDDDLQWMARLLDGIAERTGDTLLVMGHGTEHRANETYARLRDRLTARVRLACVEGSAQKQESCRGVPSSASNRKLRHRHSQNIQPVCRLPRAAANRSDPQHVQNCFAQYERRGRHAEAGIAGDRANAEGARLYL